MRPLYLCLVLVVFGGCRREEPSPLPSPADSATAAMDALSDRPSQDSVRMEGMRYAAALATGSGSDRTLTVTLGADGNAELRSDYGEARAPTATPGAWTDAGDGLVSTRFEAEEMMWRRTEDSLVAVAYDVGTYGASGLRLKRVQE